MHSERSAPIHGAGCLGQPSASGWYGGNRIALTDRKDTDGNMKIRKKLIEVALPLDAINAAAAREKSIRHGHPSTLHLWWARRPLAAARAVLFAQLVDDPASRPELFATVEEQDRERERLFRLIDELVKWENTTNETVMQAARDEIRESWRRTCADNADHPRAAELYDPERLPAFHDPFAGGGALPLEAQRLGLEAHASDLNPVAVLINKAMIEIPPKFAGRPPENPDARADSELLSREWRGAQGLAEDVRFYGRWMRDEAEKRIGHLYPKIEITAEMVRDRPDLKPYEGRKLTAIAWLWARTVKSPNPAFVGADVPLASTFMLSTKKGKEAYIEPIIEGQEYRFAVRVSKPPDPAAAKRGSKSGGSGSPFLCLMSGSPMPFDYLRTEGKAGRLGARLLAIVAKGDRERVYLTPNDMQERPANVTRPSWTPDTTLPPRALGFRVQEYGMDHWRDLFTHRQLVALATFSDLVAEAMERVRRDAVAAGLPDDGRPLRDGGAGATAYAEAVAVYLGLVISKIANIGSSIASWMSDRGAFRETFARQAIPMVWDFAEANPFADTGGSFRTALEKGALVAEKLPVTGTASSTQSDAATQTITSDKVVSTDPPYYDNIGYADLSDFFYVWLRRSQRSVFPDLFATLAVPKAEELVANPYRHGNKLQAEEFFLSGMTLALARLATQGHPAYPISIYYAFKQSESTGGSRVPSTGWATFLEAVMAAGLSVSGTWPIRTEGFGRIRAIGSNALASSIAIVCRKRAADASIATRRDFIAGLKTELPAALSHLQRGNIAPVDLAQAAIGPGMAVYTRYAKVLDASGKRVPVGEALALINHTLDEILAEQEGDFDADSRWALAWFEQHGFDAGDYGIAETLSTAKNTSVEGMVQAGILRSQSGNVRLLRPRELAPGWDPVDDDRLTTWEAVHHLIRVLDQGGETAAATLVRRLGGLGEVVRDLCYRLYTVCERKKRAAEALAYNGLVQSWPEISRLARMDAQPGQTELFDDGTDGDAIP